LRPARFKAVADEFYRGIVCITQACLQLDINPEEELSWEQDCPLQLFNDVK